MRPAKTQISLGIRPVWSESSLCAQWVVKDPSFLHADSEDSDQTGRMPRLIWVFAGRTHTLLVYVAAQLYLLLPDLDNGPVCKSHLVRTKSLSYHGPDQIWLCNRGLLKCKDHGPIEFGTVQIWTCKRSLLIKYISLVKSWLLERQTNTTNWASLVRLLILSLGFYEIWLQQGIGNSNIFVSLLKQRLTDTFIQNRQARLKTSSRAVLYKSIAIFQMQPYLEQINIRKFCQAFSRLRMSSNRLEIESGRWARPNSIPWDDRKCNICSVLEDELHFVLECSRFAELRKNIFLDIIGTDLECTNLSSLLIIIT